MWFYMVLPVKYVHKHTSMTRWCPCVTQLIKLTFAGNHGSESQFGKSSVFLLCVSVLVSSVVGIERREQEANVDSEFQTSKIYKRRTSQ